MTTVLATAADERYGYWLLNLIASAQVHRRRVDRIVAYDLGLSPFQRLLLERCRGVETRNVPEFVPFWRQGRTWKLWIWRYLEADRILWLDAGVTILRTLDDPLAQIAEHGYFAVANGHPNRPSIPSDWYERFGIGTSEAERPGISTGIFGFATAGLVYDDVIVPSFESALAGDCLGFSTEEAERFNLGLDHLSAPMIRDCPAFRWDQSVVNVQFAKALPAAHVNDVYKYGGWMSRHDHPEQIFWNHRRRGDFGYLPRLSLEQPWTVPARAWGLWFRWRWWARNHSWLFRPKTYLRKARRIAVAAFTR
jgi:hypothetical protein